MAQVLKVKVEGLKKGARKYWEKCREEYAVPIDNVRETMIKELTNIWDRYDSITHLEFGFEAILPSSVREEEVK